MQMKMIQQGLIPGVQNRSDPQYPETALSKFGQGLPDRMKQNIDEGFLVDGISGLSSWGKVNT